MYQTFETFMKISFRKSYIYLEISIVLYPFFITSMALDMLKLCWNYLYCDTNEHWAFSNCDTFPNYHDDFTNITLRLPSNKKETENKQVIRNVNYVTCCFLCWKLFCIRIFISWLYLKLIHFIFQLYDEMYWRCIHT